MSHPPVPLWWYLTSVVVQPSLWVELDPSIAGNEIIRILEVFIPEIIGANMCSDLQIVCIVELFHRSFNTTIVLDDGDKIFELVEASPDLQRSE